MPLTSDPHAWLRPFYAAVRSHPPFVTFAPAIQFDQLVEAVAREHPSKAATMREWSVGMQHGLLLDLASLYDERQTLCRRAEQSTCCAYAPIRGLTARRNRTLLKRPQTAA